MNITKRKNAYRVRVFNGKDTDGKFLYSSMTIRFDDPRFEGLTEKKRDKAADAIAFEFEQQVNSLAVLPNITFKCFAERWFVDYADIQHATTTRERCEDFRERTYEALGDMRMDKIKTIHVQSFINSLTKPGVNKVDPDKGLSRKTIKHYLSFVSSIFDYEFCLYCVMKNNSADYDTP